jgi:hypothetical protein
VPRLRIALLSALAMLAIATAPAAASGGQHSRYGETTLKLDPAAISALTGLGVAPSPIAPARALAADTLAFPITNSVKGALRSGAIRHSGGIALTAGSTRVELRDFVIDPLRGQLTAQVGTARVPILSLDFSRARLALGWGSLRLGPVGGSLTAVAAGALDGAFGLPAGTVPAGLKLGDATVRYRLF